MKSRSDLAVRIGKLRAQKQHRRFDRAPRAHKLLGTTSGAYRLSTGPFNTLEDIHYACRSLGELCESMTAR